MTEDQSAPSAPPVKVDGTNRRHGDDALEGHFVEIIEGEFKGAYASFEKVLEHAEDGYPYRILVRTRDDASQLLSVLYEQVKAARTRGGR